ncbi:MAG: hypothetical protein RIR28_96 [Pseudomonadota bacterium]
MTTICYVSMTEGRATRLERPWSEADLQQPCALAGTYRLGKPAVQSTAMASMAALPSRQPMRPKPW